jgi:alpha-glucosidase (family GH31 glycosyl hydrolase)
MIADVPGYGGIAGAAIGIATVLFWIRVPAEPDFPSEGLTILRWFERGGALRAILPPVGPLRVDTNHMLRQIHLVRLHVVLVAVGLVLALVLTTCGSTPTPGTKTLAASEAEPSPVAMLPEPRPGARSSTTPEPKPPTGAQPVLDVTDASIGTGDGKAPTPFLQGLSLWTGDGQRIDAGQVLSATVTTRDGNAARRAHWTVATRGEEGRTLSVLAESVAEGILSVVVTPTQSSGVTAVGVCLRAESDERFYGLGERFDAFDLTGHVIKNRTAEEAGLRTTYAPATFLLSSRGHGLHLETMGHATFDLRTSEAGCYQVRVAGNSLHLYFFAGPTPQDVVARHAQWIGLPPLPPEWAFGVWKNLIGGRDQVLADLQKLRDADVPIDAVWIYDAVVEEDGFGWPWQIYGPIRPGSYPNLPDLIEELHSQGLKVLGYLNPFVYPDWAGYGQAAQEGYLVQTSDGQPYLQRWTFGQRAYVDFTNAEAARWWQDRVGHALTAIGFDGAMLDFGEDAPHDAVYLGSVSGHQMDNMYPLIYHKAAFEAGQRAKSGNFVFFARAGYSGSQPYTTGRFTGDQVRNWDDRLGLPSVIPAVLNGGLSGWPYWGPDIAGFFQGERAVDGPGEKELWIRWMELGALMPTMRDMYGAMDGDPVDVWTDDETLSLFRTYAELHTSLRPYLYGYAEIAHEQGLPIVRPLFLNYPDEAEAYALEDQYLLGDDLLVAPVLEPGQRERSVYLPAGDWRDYWTDQVHEGPGRVTVPAPLHHIPLFIREGSDLDLPPLGD